MLNAFGHPKGNPTERKTFFETKAFLENPDGTVVFSALV